MANHRRQEGGAAEDAPRVPAPRKKLLDQVREALVARRYSRRTMDAYAHWIRRYILFHGKRHPSSMGPDEFDAFLTDLAVSRKVAASTQTQAMCALRFLYRVVLKLDVTIDHLEARAKRPRRLPVVLTRTGARRLLESLAGVPRLIAVLRYGSGLRISEAVALRVKDLDFERSELMVCGAGRGARTGSRCCRSRSSRRFRFTCTPSGAFTNETFQPAPETWGCRKL